MKHVGKEIKTCMGIKAYVSKNFTTLMMGILFVTMGSLSVEAAPSKTARSKDRGAQKSLAETISTAARNARRENVRKLFTELDRDQLVHLKTFEAIDQVERSPQDRDAVELASQGMLALGLDELVTQYAGRREFQRSVSFRAAHAIAQIHRGAIQNARREMPSAVDLASIPSVEARQRGMYYAAAMNLALGNVSIAMSLFERLYSEAPERNATSSLARLQRARLFYEQNQLSAAMEEVALIPRNDPTWHQAYVMSTWAAYRQGDMNLALGQLMTLRSPYLALKYAPEIHTLEAATLYRLCFYESALRSLDEYEKRYGQLGSAVQTFRQRIGSGVRGFENVMRFAGGDRSVADSSAGAYQVMDGILASDRVMAVARSWEMVERERRVLESVKADLAQVAAVRAWVNRMERRLVASSRDYARQGALAISRRLRDMQQELSKFKEQALAIRVEVNFRIRDRLKEKRLPKLAKIEFDADVAKGYEFWPFEGEFWRDELGGYFFVTDDVCDPEGR